MIISHLLTNVRVWYRIRTHVNYEQQREMEIHSHQHRNTWYLKKKVKKQFRLSQSYSWTLHFTPFQFNHSNRSQLISYRWMHSGADRHHRGIKHLSLWFLWNQEPALCLWLCCKSLDQHPVEEWCKAFEGRTSLKHTHRSKKHLLH